MNTVSQLKFKMTFLQAYRHSLIGKNIFKIIYFYKTPLRQLLTLINEGKIEKEILEWRNIKKEKMEEKGRYKLKQIYASEYTFKSMPHGTSFDV